MVQRRAEPWRELRRSSRRCSWAAGRGVGLSLFSPEAHVTEQGTRRDRRAQRGRPFSTDIERDLSNPEISRFFVSLGYKQHHADHVDYTLSEKLRGHGSSVQAPSSLALSQVICGGSQPTEEHEKLYPQNSWRTAARSTRSESSCCRTQAAWVPSPPLQV